MSATAEELKRFEDVAVAAAKEAGALIKSQFHQVKEVEHKSLVDLVTKTDKDCEAIIKGHIMKAFPDHKFVGEEDCAVSGTPELTDAPTWMVDPLDGTTNFVHGFPFVCVSIGLVINKEPAVGVVFNPVLQELYAACKGQGAFLNGSKISASSRSDLGSALLVTEMGTTRDKATVDATTGLINKLLYKVRSVRLCGSCAMNLVGVASGRLDAFYEIGFGGPWDVAAGAVILVEAGGLVFDPSGNPFDVMSRRVAGTNAHLKDSLVEAMGVPPPS